MLRVNLSRLAGVGGVARFYLKTSDVKGVSLSERFVAGSYDLVGDCKIRIADGSFDLGVRTPRELGTATGNDHGQPVILVRIRFRVLVDIDERGVIEERTIAFRHRLEPGNEIRELLHVPAADVAQHALSFNAIGP